MEYSSIFNFCSVTSANLTKVYRMKEFFSSFFSSANIIVRAKALKYSLLCLLLPLQAWRDVAVCSPRVSLRLPWAMEAIGLSARLGLTGLCAFLDFSPPWAIQHYETCDMWNHLIVTCNMKQCNKGVYFTTNK